MNVSEFCSPQSYTEMDDTKAGTKFDPSALDFFPFLNKNMYFLGENGHSTSPRGSTPESSLFFIETPWERETWKVKMKKDALELPYPNIKDGCQAFLSTYVNCKICFS